MRHLFTIEERVARFRRFYDRENHRPLLGFFLGSEYPLHQYEASRSLPVDRPLQPNDFDIESYLNDCDRLFELHESCGGDFIWSGSAFWGIPWIEAALGCPIKADHSTGSIYATVPSVFRGPDDLPAFDAESAWPAKAVEFIEAMARRSAGRWPIGTTRMRGISDLLSALYGGAESVMAMLDRPEEVKHVCRKLTDFWIAFGRLQLTYIPPFHGGVGSFYYNMWAPAGTVWHQEDAAALLSPQLYDEFIRECDERIASAFDSCIMHLHPTRFLPLDAYLGMKFKAMELHVDKGGPSVQSLYREHLRVLQSKPLLIWGQLSSADFDWIFGQLPSAGLAVLAVVEDAVQAHELWKRWMQYRVSS